MKIGIIVHSQTGNTLSVAQKLKEKLSSAGHTASIEQIKAVDEKQTDPKKMQIQKMPDISSYDALILGAPVHAFSASPVMKVYLSQLPSIQGKKVACFVTKMLPFKWTGGTGAVSHMKKSCESKGGSVVAAGVINWKSGSREKDIADLVEKFSKAF